MSVYKQYSIPVAIVAVIIIADVLMQSEPVGIRSARFIARECERDEQLHDDSAKLFFFYNKPTNCFL